MNSPVWVVDFPKSRYIQEFRHSRPGSSSRTVFPHIKRGNSDRSETAFGSNATVSSRYQVPKQRVRVRIRTRPGVEEAAHLFVGEFAEDHPLEECEHCQEIRPVCTKTR